MSMILTLNIPNVRKNMFLALVFRLLTLETYLLFPVLSLSHAWHSALMRSSLVTGGVGFGLPLALLLLLLEGWGFPGVFLAGF